MGQQNLFKGRDKRKGDWFWMDNEYLNGYAKFFGATGTAIYLSLCRHADNGTQECFPAMKTISEEIGMSENAVKKYIHLLEKFKLIRVERDRDNRTKKWLSNIYTLLDKSEWIIPDKPLWKKKRKDSHSQPLPMGEPEPLVDKSHSQPLANNKTTIINKTNTIAAASTAPQIFNLKDELTKLKTSPQRHIQLIGEYLEEKKIPIETADQLKVAIKRHLRAAVDLSKFSDKRIGDATIQVEKDCPQYTLESLVKFLVR